MNEEQKRREFEDWYKGKFCSRLSDRAASIALRTNSKGEYDSYHVREAWETWQAALASQARCEPDYTSMVVMEFSGNKVPEFSQGYRSHELLEVVTAERCAAMVEIIRKQADKVRELEKDAAIGKIVRSKLISCNNVPVSRCHITAEEIQAIDEAMKGE